MKTVIWSIGRKLAAGFAAVIILTIAVGVAGLYALNTVKTEVNTTTTRNARLEKLANLINISLLEARRSEKDFFLRYKSRGIAEAKAEYVTKVQAEVAKIRAYVAEGARLVVNEEDVDRFRQIETSITNYETDYLQAVALVEKRGHVDAGLEGQFREKIHQIEEMVGAANLDRLTIDMLLLRRHEKDYLLRGEQLYIDRVTQGVAQFKQDLAGTELSAADREQLNILIEEYFGLFQQLTQTEADLAATIERYREDAHAVEPIAAAIRTAADTNFQASIANTERTIATANILEISVLALATLLGFGLAALLSRHISRPIGRLTEVAGAIAGGDLTRQVQISSRDEIGLLAAAFNRMLTNLRELIGQAQQGAAQVSAASQQLNLAAEQAGQAGQQVAATIQQVAQGAGQQTQAITEATSNVEQMTRAADGIARGAQEQAGGVQRTSDLIGEMGMLVEQVGQGARLVSEANDKVTQAARHGVSAIEQTGRGMESIRNRTIAAADKVKEMGVRSKEIGRIVETIDDIADKTDMLALNAAVEAARAGEHGRGFAVVADQVRKLSEDSKGATRDIGELIERVQETVREAIAAMENTMTEVGQGTRLAEETTRSLGEILRAAEDAVVLAERIGGAVEQLKRKSEGVATAIGAVSAVVEENTAVAEEMAASSQQVMEAVESVVSVAEENSASAEEVSAAAEEMSAQVEEVTASAQELSQLAEQLRRAVARFRLAEAGLVQPEWSGQGWEMAAVPADHPQAIQVGYRGNGRNT
jgi:methyl-accepting chemotaxis protein